MLGIRDCPLKALQVLTDHEDIVFRQHHRPELLDVGNPSPCKDVVRHWSLEASIADERDDRVDVLGW